MKLAAKVVFYLFVLVGMGFCVAFVFDELRSRAKQHLSERFETETADIERVSPSVAAASSFKMGEAEGSWRDQLAESADREVEFTDSILGRSEREGELTLEIALDQMSLAGLEDNFIELMARDLEDYRSVRFAGRVLQEIAERNPELGVALLSTLRASEKEKLVASVARGWTAVDPRAAFDWIGKAWVQADGGYIDRETQNELYVHAMGTLVSRLRDYELAAETLDAIADPELKDELVALVAHQIVQDGPENALDRLAETGTGVFDDSVLDAITDQWAARDSVGAADWAVVNEAEVSQKSVRSIAKYLSLEAGSEALAGFHGQLADVEKRDAVAAEAARLKARREQEASVDWVLAIARPGAKQAAVFDALFEIGYESLGRSVGYIDAVYTVEDVARGPVVYATLRDWLSVDVEAVVGYLGSGRANLPAALSDELLGEMEALEI